LMFRGLMVYPPKGDVRTTIEFLADARKKFDAAGLGLEVVSTGGTPNLNSIGQCGETEYRSGTSIYNDRMMIGFDVATPGDCALHVYSTVISHPVPGRIILDAGSKALTSDLGGYDTFGILPDYPAAKITKLYEEHGIVDVSASDDVPAIGEVVRVLPNHVCPVSNLFDEILCLEESGRLRSLRIDARGKTA
ncbi:MAG: D-TA family PLP-dependent enzyme, partial [Rhizobiaceae bacterium]